MEYTVFAGHLEVVAMRAMLEVNPLLGAVKADDAGVVLEGYLFVNSEVRQSFYVVGITQCEKCQAFTGLTLLSDEAVVVGSYLTVIEGEVALLPLCTPPLNHTCH